MVAPTTLQHRQLRSGKLNQHELDHIAVGDPDPTAPHRENNEPRLCQFQWTDQLSPVFGLLWICTRDQSHHGPHIAGTGDWVAAVRPT
jgi:hypothetical protein